jgi:uncharacterized OsmC-like protein
MAKLDNYLAYKASVLAQRRKEFEDDASTSRVPLEAVSYVAGSTGVRPVRMGDYFVVSDSAPGLAGNSLGPSSPQMMLGSLASCLVHTYLLQAALLGIPLDHVEIEVTGALDMSGVVGLPTEGPVTLTELGYTPRISSPASAEEVARLHDVVDQTCPVLNTLRLPVEVVRRSASIAAHE